MDESRAPEPARAAVALVGLLLFFPPDALPWIAPTACALAGLVLAAVRIGSPGAPSSLLALFVAYAALSLSWSPCPGPGLELLLGWILAASLFVLAGAVRGDDLVRLAAPLALFHGGLSLWQSRVELPRLAGELAAVADPIDRVILERALSARGFSTFALPGHLGALLAALVPMLVHELLAGPTRLRRLLAAAGIAGALAGLAGSLALGGVAALGIVAGAALLVSWRGRLSRGVVIAGLGLALLVGIVGARSEQFAHWESTQNPLSSRLRLWRHAAEVVATAPASGRGLGSYRVAWLRFAEAGDVPARNAHMSYLEIAAELGLPAAGLLLGFLALQLRRSRAPSLRLAALVLLVHAAADFDLQSPGLLAATFALAGASAGTEPRPWCRSWRRALAALALLAAVLGSLRECARTGDPSAADVAALERSIALWPLDVQARGALAGSWLGRGERDRALAEVNRARRIEPETAWLAALAGDVHVARGEAFAACGAYREAAALHPARLDYGRRADEVGTLIEAARERGSGR